MSRIYIVRHGDTFAPGEPPRRIGARTDIPLVASGQAQAAALRAAFARGAVTFDRAYTSPLLRARETAAALLAGTGMEAEPAAWLAEIDHGPDENRPEAEVLRRVGPAALRAWEREATPPPGWIFDADTRVAAWRSLLARRAAADAAADTAVLATTSSGAARFALLATSRLRADADALPSLKLRTGAFGRLDHVDGRWRVAEWDARP